MNYSEQNLHELYSKFANGGLINYRVILRTLNLDLADDVFYNLMYQMGFLDYQHNIADEFKNTGSIVWGTEYITADEDSVLDYSLFISVKHLPRILEGLKSIPTIN